MSRIEVRLGKAEAILPTMATASVQAVVTDPPAGIGIADAVWDSDKGGRALWVAWLTGILRECVRVVLPGGFLLVWALPRRAHWTAWALEDAGAEILDVVAHLQGQGWPKTAGLLKPSAEFWILARAPGPVRDLNVEACAITAPRQPSRRPGNAVLTHAEACDEQKCASGCPIALLNAQSGVRKSGSRKAGVRKGLGYHGATGDGGPAITASSGGGIEILLLPEGQGRRSTRRGQHASVCEASRPHAVALSAHYATGRYDSRSVCGQRVGCRCRGARGIRVSGD